MLRGSALILSAVVALGSGTCARAPASYSDPGGRFSITLPTGWTVIPDRTLQDYNRRAGSRYTYVAAFSRTRAHSWFEYPYALVQLWTTGVTDPESLAVALSTVEADSIPTPGLVGKPWLSAARYDRAHDLVRLESEQSSPDGRIMRSSAGFRVASFGTVGIYVYGLARDSLTTAAELDSLAAGLKIDPAHRYRSARTAPLGSPPGR